MGEAGQFVCEKLEGSVVTLVTVIVKCSMEAGAVEVKETISRGAYGNRIWAFSSGSSTKARVT